MIKGLMALQTPTVAPRGIGLELERRRLEHRARRIEFVIAALHRLADARAPDGPIPAPLRQAIGGFSQELARVDRRRADL